MSSKLYAAFAFFAFSAAAFAQPDLHACRASQEFRDIYDASKTSNDLVPTLRAALKEHPDSLFLNQMLLTAPGVKPGSLAAE